MIAKLIVKGKTRSEAIEKIGNALDQYYIEGIKTNIPMLQEVLTHKAFQKGKVTTSFVSDYINKG
jgi:acetyl-CoA carboxylase biotin carboxylase subunit